MDIEETDVYTIDAYSLAFNLEVLEICKDFLVSLGNYDFFDEISKTDVEGMMMTYLVLEAVTAIAKEHDVFNDETEEDYYLA